MRLQKHSATCNTYKTPICKTTPHLLYVAVSLMASSRKEIAAVSPLSPVWLRLDRYKLAIFYSKFGVTLAMTLNAVWSHINWIGANSSSQTWLSSQILHWLLHWQRNPSPHRHSKWRSIIPCRRRLCFECRYVISLVKTSVELEKEDSFISDTKQTVISLSIPLPAFR